MDFPGIIWQVCLLQRTTIVLVNDGYGARNIRFLAGEGRVVRQVATGRELRACVEWWWWWPRESVYLRTSTVPQAQAHTELNWLRLTHTSSSSSRLSSWCYTPATPASLEPVCDGDSCWEVMVRRWKEEKGEKDKGTNNGRENSVR